MTDRADHRMFQSTRSMVNQDESETGFRFGKGLIDKGRTFRWDPDKEPNGHAIIWGASGSGKSRLLRAVIHHLSKSGKHIHVVDQHGDLFVDGENTMRFGGGETDYGINPFEYDSSPHAGPGMNVHAMIEIFKRTYMASMRSVQELVLIQLLLDTYRVKGIDPDVYATWKGKPPLPSIETTKELVAAVMHAIENGSYDFFNRLRESSKQLAKWREAQETLDQKESHKESDNVARQRLQDKIDDELSDLQDALRTHLEVNYLGLEPPQELDHVVIDGYNVNLELYMRKSAKRAIESLSLYIDALARHGVFSTTPPPVCAGLNRYDLSLLPDGPRHFFIEVLLAKIFRAVRLRGEYRKRPNRPRGDRVDTYIVIDEAQAILPTRSSDKESPSYMLNRLVSEARKYGLGLICVTQSPAVFPKLMFSNVVLKIGLRTNQNDIPAAQQYLGVKGSALFTHTKKDGVAMIGGKESEFHSVILDWNAMN